ncbi:MAG TPA: hypothetical protein PLS90_15835 [Candidatus Sumerlaeota bacterium]|nr:MAG: hypothetical protein BWZ08_02269 [candidate division BRC1 bacterium ADurb.BinA292]HOE95192.1 hypothetical protein [Candidatus Sumerlaeota bacterium]HOR27286.1 hypothetical protein [Candidatus Sumerlaeota bacterium]HPK03918.1 hypothetical protein [Candidatus Sumerlaeota bacterium]
MKRYLLPCVLAAVVLACSPTLVSAHEYDRDDSEHPLRLVGYALHPIGIAAEYLILRPIHWVVSQRNLDIIFGHEVNEDPDYNYFEWE